MSKMTQKELDDLVERMRADTKASKSTGNSYGAQKEITQNLLNCPEYEMHQYGADADGKMTDAVTTPVKTFRSEVAKTAAKTLGLDKADASKLEDNMEFSANAAQALNTVSDLSASLYLKTGKKKTLPAIDPDMARMGIYMDTVPEHTGATMKIVEQDGKHVQVPTGKIVTTAEHTVLKAKCSTRPWQKTSKDAK